MLKWYVLHTKPNKEEFTWSQLYARDIEAYYPCIKVKPVNPRARKSKAYFPGYLFIRIDVDVTGTSPVKWLPGTHSLVHFGDEPASIPDHLLDAIRQHVEQLNPKEQALFTNIHPGDLVHIDYGPFTGYEAIFDEQIPGTERGRVLLSFLKNQFVRVVLPMGQIRPQNPG